MQLIVCDSYEEMSTKAADIIGALISEKNDCTLGLATGSTPVGTYRELARRCAQQSLSFSKVCTYNLDEYVGLGPDSDQSYVYFMRDNFFSHIDIDLSNTHLPDGLCADIDAECRRYSDALAALSGGLDLQLLGIGINGHIGFNEPDDIFIPDTHCVELTQSTIEANARFFQTPDEVPRRALTMGVRPIMRAKTVLTLVNGAAKAPILKQALQGPITPHVPVSLLQLHENAIFIADREAAALL